jgi:hypothetical protein
MIRCPENRKLVTLLGSFTLTSSIIKVGRMISKLFFLFFPDKKQKKREKMVVVIHPTGIIYDVSVKLPESVSICLFSGYRIIGRAPIDRIHN